MEASSSRKRKLDGSSSDSSLSSSTGPESSPSTPKSPPSTGSESSPSTPKSPPSTGPESSSSTPKSPPKRIGDYEILKELNYDDYVFEREDGSTFPVLSPVSDSRGNGGLCSYYATTDVCETRMRILEATLPPKTTSYFGNYFGDTLSTQNLIDTGLEDGIVGLFDHMVTVGVTSKDEYDRKSRGEGDSGLKDLTGCRKFTIDSWRSIKGEGLHVTVADIEAESEVVDEDEQLDDYSALNDYQTEKLVTKVLRRFGPVLGVYAVTMDNAMLCEQDIYDQTIDSRPLLDPTDNVQFGHAVMLVGYGIARHVPTNQKVSYYVLQNNQGEGNNNKGRILAEILYEAAIPVLFQQCDLEMFRLMNGNRSMKMIKKQQFN